MINCTMEKAIIIALDMGTKPGKMLDLYVKYIFQAKSLNSQLNDHSTTILFSEIQSSLSIPALPGALPW